MSVVCVCVRYLSLERGSFASHKSALRNLRLYDRLHLHFITLSMTCLPQTWLACLPVGSARRLDGGVVNKSGERVATCREAFDSSAGSKKVTVAQGCDAVLVLALSSEWDANRRAINVGTGAAANTGGLALGAAG